MENKNFLQQQLVQLEKTLYLKHKFALIVTIFNHYPYRDKLIRKINRIFKNSKNMEITRESYPNFETFEEQLASFSKTYSLIHIINNGERLYKETMPLFYKGLNYHREGIAKENPVTIILWMLPEDVEDFAYNAPDMWSWHGGIFDFEIPEENHENNTTFPFIRLTPQEKEKRQKRINEIRDYLEAKPELDDRLKASLQQELAKLYYVLSDYINAETYALKCLELHRKKGNVEEMYRIYHILESIYRDTGETGKALNAIESRILLKKSSDIDRYILNKGEDHMEEEKKKPTKILVADDEPDMKALIEQKFKDMIRSSEWEFVYAADGSEALKQIETHPDIYVILLDINMPIMDGLTLLDKLSAMNMPTIKIIMVTAYGDMENIRKSMNKGAFDFITKKIDFNDLKITIEKAIKESSIIRNALEAQKNSLISQKELGDAAQVQKSILPYQFPSYLFADMRAAKEVLGDFYDYTIIDKNRIAFFVGDVEGKGLPAALLAIKCSTILKKLAQEGKRADVCLEILNNCLIEERDETIKNAALSVSLFYGEMDLRSGHIDYSIGGKMGYICIIYGDGNVIRINDSNDFPLGLFGNRDYSCKKEKLNKNDIICICTDGVEDAQDIKGESFGDDEKRVTGILKKTADRTAKETVETFMTEIASFVGKAPQTDDITIMAVKAS